jgi:hypothetical protein
MLREDVGAQAADLVVQRLEREPLADVALVALADGRHVVDQLPAEELLVAAEQRVERLLHCLHVLKVDFRHASEQRPMLRRRVAVPVDVLGMHEERAQVRLVALAAGRGRVLALRARLADQLLQRLLVGEGHVGGLDRLRAVHRVRGRGVLHVLVAAHVHRILHHHGALVPRPRGLLPQGSHRAEPYRPTARRGPERRARPNGSCFNDTASTCVAARRWTCGRQR